MLIHIIKFCYDTVTTSSVFHLLRCYKERKQKHLHVSYFLPLFNPLYYLKYGKITENQQIKCFKKLQTVASGTCTSLQAMK